MSEMIIHAPDAVFEAAARRHALVMAALLNADGSGRTVNSLDPSPVEGAGIFTHMKSDLRQSFYDKGPMRRLPRAQDLIGAVGFLLSEGAALVSAITWPSLAGSGSRAPERRSEPTERSRT
ncbi:MAG TPA: hypothetical protein VGU19_14680 [Microvirga sp.]|jgi:hypothetical protein|nr:hypothetical protein [Microvirga sp.]